MQTPRQTPHIEEVLRHHHKTCADALRTLGFTLEIHTGLPYVAIDGPGEFFCQEHEAQELLDSVPEWADPEDYLLYYLDGAGWFL